MDSRQLKLDYLILGVEPDSSRLDVERAYQEKRNLYDIDSLATYSLFDDEDRQVKLSDIQNAYRHIIRHMAQGGASTSPCPEAGEEEEQDRTEQGKDTLEINGQPGCYLKQLREKAGLSIRDVADRTKIGPFQLENIEDERFDKLPAPVYLRGFVLEFARMVGAPDPPGVAGVYVERFREERRDHTG
ncbi:MAG: helix-turn-helix transcriptional regulator [Desulfuromonadales bacterium]